jgi:hypothetical protein
MKNALMIPVVFLANLLLWLCLISFFSVLSEPAALGWLAARDFLALGGLFLSKALFFLPLAGFIALLFVHIFLMRHSTVVWASVPLVLLMAGLLVAVFIPFSYFTEQKLAVSGKAQRSDTGTAWVSNQAGTIFTADTGACAVWFTALPANNRVAPVVVVGPEPQSGSATVSVYEAGEIAASERRLTVPKTDVRLSLPAESREGLALLRLGGYSLGEDVEYAQARFRALYDAAPRGYYLAAGSLVLAFVALTFLGFASGWRLINALLVFAFARGLLAAYRYTVSGPVAAAVGGVLPLPWRGQASPALYLAFAVTLAAVATVVAVVRRVSRGGQAVSYE